MGSAVHWIIALLILAVTASYFYFCYKFTYWKKRKIPYVEPSFPMGNLSGFPLHRNLGQILTNIYNRKKKSGFVGMWFFQHPVLLATDLDLIKNVLVRDNKYFPNRGSELLSKDVDPLSEHLFSMRNGKWKNLRVKLTPAFSSGKIKKMFPILIMVGKKLESTLSQNDEVYVKEVVSRYMMDVISSCAFGLNSNCMEDSKSEFYSVCNQFLNPTFRDYCVAFLYAITPKVPQLLKLRAINKRVNDFFINLTQQTIEKREKEQIERNDFLQLLIALMNNGYIPENDSKLLTPDTDLQKFSINQIAAQVFVFFLAGFETTSNTIQFALYELALATEIQKQARAEVMATLKKFNGEVVYESLQEMDLLGRIIAETLRKYPVLQHLFRECSSDYEVDGTSLTVERNIWIVIPVYAIHHDPDIYPDPQKFNPDRFLPKEKETRHRFAYIPFGEGPRNCIGARLALMQIKTTLALILSQFEIIATPNTPLTLEFDPTVDALTPKRKIVLKFNKL